MSKTVVGMDGKKPSKNKKKTGMDYKKPLQEILELVEKANDRLGRLTFDMDDDDLSTDALDEAMDALEDAMDLIGEGIENLEDETKED